MNNKIKIDSHPCVGMAKRILTKKDIYHLPSVTVQAPFFIPPIPAVYFIFHKKEIVYIGATSCMADRIPSHKIITENYDNKNTLIYFLVLPTSVMRKKFEHKFIEQFQPRLNIKRNFRLIKCKHKNALSLHENMEPYCPDCEQSFESYWHVENNKPNKRS